MKKYQFEEEYWGDCCNTFDEDQKHYVYAKYMGINKENYYFNVNGISVIDIGGGPTSMLLKTKNLSKGIVVDPILYPEWVYSRYDKKGIKYSVSRGEDIDYNGLDECWIYNCLQHVDDPSLIIKKSLESAKTLRLFEWINIPAHDGHPNELTKKDLDSWIGKNGNVIDLNESGCFGLAYFNIYKK
jgi:hypothetical protein